MRVGDGYFRAPAVLPLELIMFGGCAVPRNRMHTVAKRKLSAPAGNKTTTPVSSP